MNRFIRSAIVATAVLGSAGIALAAGGEHGGEHHGIDITRLGFQLLNFGALIFIVVRFAGRAVNKSLAARHEQLKKDLEEASQARAAAEARLKEHERRLANLEAEASRLRASIKEEAEREQARLLAAAEEKARRLQDEARFLMEQQVKEAELRFRNEVAATAVQVAEEIVRKALRPEDDARLVTTFVGDLERTPAQGGA